MWDEKNEDAQVPEKATHLIPIEIVSLQNSGVSEIYDPFFQLSRFQLWVPFHCYSVFRCVTLRMLYRKGHITVATWLYQCFLRETLPPQL